VFAGAVPAKPRVVVVGGGITGAFAALAAAPVADVVLIERRRPVDSASTRNPGGLNPRHGLPVAGPLADLAADSLRRHRALWEQWGDERVGRPVRRLHVALDDAEAADLRAAAARHRTGDGFTADWREPAEAREIEPALQPGIAGALDVSGNYRVEPTTCLAAVTEQAVRCGATLREGEAIGITARGDAVTAVTTAGGSVDCDALVIATGPWVTAPARWLGAELPVISVRGEMLLVAGYPIPVRSEISHGIFGAYPNPDATVWLGGTEDASSGDAEPTETGRRQILDAADRILAGVASAAVLAHTAGHRPMTPDHLPIVGAVPGWTNVAVALGGGRKGMLLSAALGQAAVDVVLEGTTRLPIAGMQPGRDMRQP